MTTSGVTRPGEGPAIPYAGQQLHVLAGAHGGPWAVAEMVVPPRFPGPVPHVHTTFDEGIYVIEGVLLVAAGQDEPVEAAAGSFFGAARGTRHRFSNPGDRPARVLGLWSPPDEGLDFMRAVGAALPASGPPDPEASARSTRRTAATCSREPSPSGAGHFSSCRAITRRWIWLVPS